MRTLAGVLFLTVLATPLQGLDGVDFYYGLGVEQDYHQALVEFQKEENFHLDVLFEILVYLNGDGVPKDSAKALEIWRTKIDKIGWSDMTTANLRKLIDERLALPASSSSHLSFEDIAMTTVDINEAANIRSRIQENRQTQVITQVESLLAVSELESWSNLKRLIVKISKLDSERVYTEYIDGTIRTAYFFGIQHLILANFLDRAEHWLLNRPMVTSDELVFNEIDSDLNATYQALIRSLRENYQEMIDMYQDDHDSQQKYRTYVKEMVAGLIDAQRAWIEYRDTWAKLLLERYDGPDPTRFELYVKSGITKDRLSELEYAKLE